MINKEIFNQLQSHDNKLSVSLYVPMEITGDYEKNRIRWKNACQEAKKELESREEGAGKMMRPAEALIEDSDFWAHQSACLAGFYSKDYDQTLHLANSIMDIVSVNDNFYTSPLISEVTNNERIFILAISKNETRFFEAVPDGIYPVKISDVVVDDMDEALNLDDPAVSTQHHSAGGGAIYHANGPGTDMDTIRTKQYMRRIDDGIMEIIHDENVPLVLACVEEYYPVYKDVTKYNHLSEHMVTGNPENLTPSQLRAQIEPVYKEIRQKKLDTFKRHFGIRSGENLTSEDMSEIATLASQDNVEQILVSKSYLKNLPKAEQEKVDDILMMVHNSGGEIFMTTDKEYECSGMMAVQRYALQQA